MTTQDPGTLRGFVDSNSTTYMGFQVHHDRLINQSMGGLLAEQPSLQGISRVLDIGCGAGGWALDVAAAFPTWHVEGIDGSANAIEYAQMLASAEGRTNASFRVANILRDYAYADDSFDLVNARSIAWKVATRGSWPSFLQECMRVVRPGGTIRLTELEIGVSNSYGLQRLYGTLAQAFYQTGMSFSPDGNTFGIAPQLKGLLRTAGCVDVQHLIHGIDASYGEPVHEGWAELVTVLDRLSTPFVVAAGTATQEERDSWYQQAMQDVRSPEFRCILFYITAWGTVPEEATR
jgi:ubiquinone/menaquinone biosynthesis C-methylase UbiE